MRVINTISPKRVKLGLDKSVNRQSLDQLSNFTTPIKAFLSDINPGLDQTAEIPATRDEGIVERKTGDQDPVSYNTSKHGNYTLSKEYISDQHRKYENNSSRVVVENRNPISNRPDIFSLDAGNFIAADLRRENENYATQKARHYDSSISAEKIGKKKKNFWGGNR